MTLQKDQPLFVKGRNRPIVWKGKSFVWQKEFPWKEMDVPFDVVANLYEAHMLYHEPNLEKQNKVGDRLEEFSGADLKTFVDRVNAHVKSKTNSADEYKRKKVKASRVDEKQRGLIRSWLRNNAWCEDKYFEIRDDLLS